jgi:hypothetical protein
MVAAPLLGFAACAGLFSVASDFSWRVLGVVAIFLGVRALWDMGSRLRALDGWEAMERDPRRPVIFLRPFREDGRVTYKHAQGKYEGGIDTASREIRRATREPNLYASLTRIGPFVAVGKPGESLATPGAARIYLSDEEWQTGVASLVRRAAAVVLQPGTTEGTRWEMALVGKIVDLRRLLLLVPNRSTRPLGFIQVYGLAAQIAPLPPLEQCPPCDAFMFPDAQNFIPLVFGGRPELVLQPFVQQILQLNETRA